MKKTKVYRPRRGMRFSDDVAPSQPKGAFIGAVLSRPHVTLPKTNIPPAKTETLDVSATLIRSYGRLDPSRALINVPSPVPPPITIDPTSKIFVPQNATEWTKVMSSASIASGGPFSVWLCQEATGNLADSIGGNTAAVSGSPQYQQTVTGWSTRAVQFGNNTPYLFSASNGSVPDASTTSCLMLIYAGLNTPTQTETIMTYGATTASFQTHTNGSVVYIAYNGVHQQTGVSNAGTAVRPVVMKVDYTNSANVVYTDQEKIVNIWAAEGNSAKTVAIGQAINDSTPFRSTTAPANILYWAAFSGSAAELSDANVRQMLRALGWNPAW